MQPRAAITVVATSPIATLLAVSSFFVAFFAAAVPPRVAAANPPVANPAVANPLDADRAMSYLEAVCDLGPRPSGSDGMTKQQELLAEHFQTLGKTVER
ncbi:MAG: hypothetical protein AAF596_10675, partial [Planctomycetota bacterium]